MENVNASHVVAVGGVTAMLANLLVWATHWPLQPMDLGTASNTAGLLVALVGGLTVMVSHKTKGNANTKDDAKTMETKQ